MTLGNLYFSCGVPINGWLLGTYLSLIIGRSMVILVNNIDTIPPVVMTLASCFTVLIVMPFFVIWTGVGTLWYVEIVSKHEEETCVRIM